METQVGIVGAGPAGLLLSHLLSREGVESVVLERQTQEYVEQRVRAGVLEQGSVDLLTAADVGERMHREGLVHHGILLRFRGVDHRIDFGALTEGRGITVYGQQEIVKDLIAARWRDGGTVLFEAAATGVNDINGRRPRVAFEQKGAAITLECSVVAGCDGFHGISRHAIPDAGRHSYTREYPFAWLGILADVAPSSEELIYCYHPRGFALLSMRGPQTSRLYLQVPADERIESWSDDRIWSELACRLESPGWTLNDGPIIDRGITGMRSYVAEPMQSEQLFLAGDAAHIVPPTGAKGMNLAIRDVTVLAEGIAAHLHHGDRSLLDAYSATCLRRVWRAQHFSWWMTSMLHRFPDEDEYQQQLQLAQLDYTVNSPAASLTLAENYVGYEWR